MSTLSIRIPEKLKRKAMQLARKNEMSFNAYINHWLQIAVTREETLEWMEKRLSTKNSEERIRQFGLFLDETQTGREPGIKKIRQLLEK